MIVRNDLFAKYLNIEGNFWKISEKIYRLQTDKKPNMPIGFKDYSNPELSDKVYVDIEKKEIDSACKINTYCKYDNGIYYLENICKNMVILSPELRTKKQLGLHIYDDRRIEVNYDKFIKEVDEIWEERTPIEGFVFDVESIHYIKKR